MRRSHWKILPTKLLFVAVSLISRFRRHEFVAWSGRVCKILLQYSMETLYKWQVERERGPSCHNQQRLYNQQFIYDVFIIFLVKLNKKYKWSGKHESGYTESIWINLSQTNVLFLYPLKRSEHQKWNRNGTLASKSSLSM